MPDLPDVVDGQFARRLHGIYMSIGIAMSEGIMPSVVAPITNHGYPAANVNLATLQQAAEDIRSDVAALLRLLADEAADRA